MIEYYNEDCMEGMKQFPDKYFDLAIVDPPYGIGDKLLNGGHNGTVTFHEQYAVNKWDNDRPTKEYFDELRRVSANQIIWGANYYLDYLQPSRGVICWDKNLGSPYNFSHWEMAWTSFDCIARRIILNSNTGDRIHPTQKPVALYKWLLKNYAKPGDKILDTHVGSASSLIACYDMGFDAVGFELDADYYRMSKQRLDDFIRQPRITECIDQFEQIRMGEA
jgi:site-specific DNA-methyltransferase (adenine-specific)